QVLLLCVKLDEGRTETLVREAVEARQPGAVNVTRGEDRLVTVALHLVLRNPDNVEVPRIRWRSLALVRLCERRQAIGRFHEAVLVRQHVVDVVDDSSFARTRVFRSAWQQPGSDGLDGLSFMEAEEPQHTLCRWSRRSVVYGCVLASPTVDFLVDIAL